MSGRVRVLVTERIVDAGMAVLRHPQVEVVGPLASPEELPDAIRDVDGLLVRTMRIPGDLIRSAPRLKVIAKHGVGTDNIDRQACEERGVKVTVTADANKETVAEFVLGLFIAVARHLVAADAAVRAGRFSDRDRLMGREWMGKTIGIVGYGRIGQALAPRLVGGLKARVLVYDPYWPAGAVLPPEARRVDAVETLLEASDGVTVHVPLGPETYHLLNRERIARMRPQSYLVNAARGGVVDGAALYEALRSGHLAGAALDVFDPEPPRADDPLLSLPNVVLAPHLAATTAEAMERMARAAATSILQVLGVA
ncbi:MAG: hydroxyacid dehydrogenase [Actinomycetia bacterium]|nr:hydroxyacid dehydrogenase [Actinomycetes bacterium]